MSRLQPVGQKRLTNICIVRLKRGGKRFEVAAYRNTVVAWRDHVEKDIDEVLQVHTIFANLDKGILAKSEDLTEAFGTDNEDTVCVEILNKGEFQVSEQERQMQVDALFRDVATRVTDMCVNPETQKPYPLTTIERAMRHELHFAPALGKTAKQQALVVIKQLEAADVLPIARARMHLRLVVPVERLAGTQAALRALRGEEPSASSDATAAPDASGGVSEARANGADAKLSVGAPEESGASVSITCIADPGLYRPLSELAKAMTGSLQVVELKASAESQASGGAAGSGSAAASAAESVAAGGPPPPEATPRAGGLGGAAAVGAGGAGGAASARSARGAAGGGRGGAGGQGEADTRRAERMFKLNLRNAEGGDPVAQLEVGKAYAEGKGVDVDGGRAKEWFEKAAQQGVKAAMSRLEALALEIS